ncbi:MAG: flagellar export chaperone FliS [Gammaproteobacteria bacterium]|nr:flagellar export chaperone FliS [Gammaproteobacteria bacterium]
MNNSKGVSGALNAYNQVAVQTGVNDASPHRLIQMLIDAALEKIAAAKGLMLNGRIAEKGQQIGLAVSIIDGLRISVDKVRGGDVAQNLEDLYVYINDRLTEANLTNNTAFLDEVTSLLRPIKEAWDAIPDDVRLKHQQQQEMQDKKAREAAATG